MAITKRVSRAHHRSGNAREPIKGQLEGKRWSAALLSAGCYGNKRSDRNGSGGMKFLRHEQQRWREHRGARKTLVKLTKNAVTGLGTVIRRSRSFPAFADTN